MTEETARTVAALAAVWAVALVAAINFVIRLL